MTRRSRARLAAMSDPARTPPQRSDRTEPLLAHGSVYLRPAERDDLPRFVSWLNDARTARTLAVISPLSNALEDRWFERLLEQQGQSRWHFVTCLVGDDRPVGAIELFDLDTTNGSAGLGIVIGDPEDTNQGYGSDALRALVAFGFDELRLERIWLDVYDFNERARRVYQRVGFVHEGTLRRALFRGGVHHDVHRMAILREEWSALSS
jgi:RimJ/RimL family protein N-acetyltransferase